MHNVTFNPHRGNLLLSGSQDGTVRLWDVRDVKPASTSSSIRKFSGQADGVRDVKWSPTDGVDFAFGTDGGWIQRWDLRFPQKPKLKVPAHSLACNAIDWHPDGKHLLTGSSDHTLAVWDLSHPRPRKPSWEIHTPHPVLHARWRPSCASASSTPATHCTQAVASYAPDHPAVHIWDFRRPALPYRFLAPCASAPSDLLWHSQDLLWSVGRDGAFRQSDTLHAARDIDHLPLSVCATTPDNHIVACVRRRAPRRPSPRTDPFPRSLADDALDNSFLPAPQPRPRSPLRTRSESLAAPASDPPTPLLKPTRVLPLNDLLRSAPRPPLQAMFSAPLPTARPAHVLPYLAAHYQLDLDPASPTPRLTHLTQHNSRAAQAAGLPATSRTWLMLGLVLAAHLERRVARLHLPAHAEHTRGAAALRASAIDAVEGEEGFATPEEVLREVVR